MIDDSVIGRVILIFHPHIADKKVDVFSRDQEVISVKRSHAALTLAEAWKDRNFQSLPRLRRNPPQSFEGISPHSYVGRRMQGRHHHASQHVGFWMLLLLSSKELKLQAMISRNATLLYRPRALLLETIRKIPYNSWREIVDYYYYRHYRYFPRDFSRIIKDALYYHDEYRRTGRQKYWIRFQELVSWLALAIPPSINLYPSFIEISMVLGSKVC